MSPVPSRKCALAFLLIGFSVFKCDFRHGRWAAFKLCPVLNEAIRGRTDSIVGVTYFDTSASDDFAEFDKAFIALFQVVSGNTWIESLPTHSPEGSVNFGNVSLPACTLITMFVRACVMCICVCVDLHFGDCNNNHGDS